MDFKKKVYENQFLENFRSLDKKYPFLQSITSKLNKKRVKYGLCGGMSVWLITSSRETSDFDFLIADKHLEKVKKIFPEAEVKNKEYGDFLYLEKSTVEIGCNLNPQFEDTKYSFRLTDLAAKHLERYTTLDLKLYLLNPADTVLMKAMFQRGNQEGKHDFVDIEHIVNMVKIDKDYLAKRFKECECDDRVKRVLQSFNLLW